MSSIMDSKHSISNILDFYKKSIKIPESGADIISENLKKIDTNGDNFISYRELNQYKPRNNDENEKKWLLYNWNYLSPSDESNSLKQLPVDTCPPNHPKREEQSKRLVLIIDAPLRLEPQSEININNKVDPGEIPSHAGLHETAIKLDSPCVKTEHLNKFGPLPGNIVDRIKKISEENPDKPIVVSSSVASYALLIKENDLNSLLPEDFESKNNLSPSSINASNYFKEPYRSAILEEFKRKLVTGDEIEAGIELVEALAIVDILKSHPSGGKYVTSVGNNDNEVNLIRLVEGIKTIGSQGEDGKLKDYNSRISATAEYKAPDEVRISAERHNNQINYVIYTNNDPKNLNKVKVPVVDTKLGNSFIGRDFNSVPKATKSDLTTLTELEKLLKEQKSTGAELTLEDLKIRNEISRKYSTVKSKLIVGPNKELQSYEVHYDDTAQKYEAVIKNYRIDKQGQLYQYYEGSSFAKPLNKIFNDLEAQKTVK